jgi:hypothetical protein
VDWRAYGLSQPKDVMPVGPVIFMVHIASAWVPFTQREQGSRRQLPGDHQGDQARPAGVRRQMQIHLRRRARIEDELKKRSYIDKYIPHIGEALQEMLKLSDAEKDKVIVKLRDTLEKSGSWGEEPAQRAGRARSGHRQREPASAVMPPPPFNPLLAAKPATAPGSLIQNWKYTGDAGGHTAGQVKGQRQLARRVGRERDEHQRQPGSSFRP